MLIKGVSMNPMWWLENNLPKMPNKARKVIQFVFLWQEYNFYYNERQGRRGSELDRVLALGKDDEARRFYETHKSDFIAKFSSIHSNVEHNNPRTKLYTDISSRGYVEYYADAKDTLEDFLTVVYKIRCNFMHGDKLRNEDVQVDVKLIGWAYDCLLKLLSGIHYFDKV